MALTKYLTNSNSNYEQFSLLVTGTLGS